MSLSNTYNTLYLPKNDGSGTDRAIYTLKDDYYKSNLASVNAGVYNPLMIAANNGIGAYYPTVIGGKANIKGCKITSGDQTLDELKASDVPQNWWAVETLNCSNRYSTDINRNVLHNGWGFGTTYTVSGVLDPPTLQAQTATHFPGSLTLSDTEADFASAIFTGATPATDVSASLNNQFRLAGSVDGPSVGLDWSTVFPMLKDISVLPKIPQLTLTHTYNNAVGDYIRDADHSGALITSVASINPLLKANQLVGFEPTGQTYQLPYRRVGFDRGFLIPAAASTTVPTRTGYKSVAMNGLLVKRITLWNAVSTDNVWLGAKTRSPAMLGETIQVTINGFPLFPNNGVNNEAQKMNITNMSRGSMNLPLGCYMSGLKSKDEGYVFDALVTKTPGYTTSTITSQFSILTFEVNTVIETFEINYSRLQGSAGDQTDPFVLAIMYEYQNLLTVPVDGPVTSVKVSY